MDGSTTPSIADTSDGLLLMLYIVFSIGYLAIIVTPVALSILVVPRRAPNLCNPGCLVGMDFLDKGGTPFNLARLLFQIVIATRSNVISLIWLGCECTGAVGRGGAGRWVGGWPGPNLWRKI